MRGLYTIIDRITKDIVGGIQLHKHDAAAIRTFSDVARDPHTMIARHPQDYYVVRLGFLTDDENTTTDLLQHADTPIGIVACQHTIILDGETWVAANSHTKDI